MKSGTMKLDYLVILWLLWTVDGNRNIAYKKRPSLNHNTCASVTFNYGNILSAIQCMAICTQNPSCNTAQYLPGSRVCLGCLEGSSLSVSKEGAQVFDRIDSGCMVERDDNIHVTAALQIFREKGASICLKQVIEVTNGVAYGDWCHPEFCERGEFAYGYAIKIDDMSTFGIDDDTGANAIKLLCRSRNEMSQTTRPTSCVGPKGIWRGPVTCKNDSRYQVLKSFQMKVEQPSDDASTLTVFVDETTVKYAHFTCGSLTAHQGNETLGVQYGNFPWAMLEDSGTPSEWSESCGPGRGICGLRTRMHQVIVEDETGLNDVVFYCC